MKILKLNLIFCSKNQKENILSYTSHWIKKWDDCDSDHFATYTVTRDDWKKFKVFFDVLWVLNVHRYCQSKFIIGVLSSSIQIHH